MRTILLLAGLAVACTAQPAFEVASLKPTSEEVASRAEMSCQGGPGTPSPGRFTCTNAPLKMLICMAYNLQFTHVTAPEWTASIGYELAATVPAGVTRDQFRSMLQNLLAERFRLTVHRETKEISGFVLAVARGGAKIKAVASGGAAPTLTTGRGPGMLQNLAGYLSVQLQSPVENETGLVGEYDFNLQFVPPQVSAAQDAGPSLFTALEEQLGVTLRSKKIPASMLVVDRADRTPSAN